MGDKIQKKINKAGVSYEAALAGPENSLNQASQKAKQTAFKAKKSGENVKAGINYSKSLGYSAVSSFYTGLTFVARPALITQTGKAALQYVADTVAYERNKPKTGNQPRFGGPDSPTSKAFNSFRQNPLDNTVRALSGYVGGVAAGRVISSVKSAPKKIRTYRQNRVWNKYGEGAAHPFSGDYLGDYPEPVANIEPTIRGSVKTELVKELDDFTPSYRKTMPDTGLIYGSGDDLGIVDTNARINNMKPFSSNEMQTPVSQGQQTAVTVQPKTALKTSTKPALKLRKTLVSTPGVLESTQYIPAQTVTRSISGLVYESAPVNLFSGVGGMGGAVVNIRTSQKQVIKSNVALLNYIDPSARTKYYPHQGLKPVPSQGIKNILDLDVTPTITPKHTPKSGSRSRSSLISNELSVTLQSTMLKDIQVQKQKNMKYRSLLQQPKTKKSDGNIPLSFLTKGGSSGSIPDLNLNRGVRTWNIANMSDLLKPSKKKKKQKRGGR